MISLLSVNVSAMPFPKMLCRKKEFWFVSLKKTLPFFIKWIDHLVCLKIWHIRMNTSLTQPL